VLLFAVPIGYALSRCRFPGRSIIETLVDVPIVLPPVVIGLSLLAFFGTGVGSAIRAALAGAGWTLTGGIGIVMCQFLVSVPYCIRATKASFDAIDGSLEDVAMSLGCSRWAVFRRVALPLARSGLVAGGVMAWARAIGVFGPLMVFVGTGPRVQVMPTAMWLELNVGNIEAAFVIALVSLAMAGAALVVVHRLDPGRTWI
jgi:molybdate transport system permease protein